MPEPRQRSVVEALREAERRLAEAGVASPGNDAEILLADALDIERSGLARLVVLDARLDAEADARFEALVVRRSTRVPLQHLTGRAPFRYLELAVGPGVFVPRPETEQMAGYVIDALPEDSAATVVDLCAGSGAIALSVAHERPSAVVHAVEWSDDAFLWLQRNAEAWPSVHLHHADATTFLPVELIGACDVVVTNPPYVPDDAVIRDPEVVEHDPGLALWGGPDGLDVVRALRRVAATLLRPGGLFVVEHADLQGDSLPALLNEQVDPHGEPVWRQVQDHADLAGRPRFTSAVREDGAATSPSAEESNPS